MFWIIISKRFPVFRSTLNSLSFLQRMITITNYII
nr:MAG TPA: Porcine arterivirus-type cysteine proteinase alpha [Caudoviricetes sp.]